MGKEVILIEKIGLDRMVIAGFRVIRVDFKKLRQKENVTLDEYGKATYTLEGGKSFRFLRIVDNVQFRTLVVGTKDLKYAKQDYSRMDITIGNRETGNLQNFTVKKYQERVKDIFLYVYEEYGILIDDKNTKITYLELNCTFPIEYEFYKYHRVLRLMMYNLPNNYRKITEVSKKNVPNIRLESETFYRGNSMMEIKVYDKKRQLKETVGFCNDDNLMRIEMVMKTAQKIKEAFGSNKLSDLTDSSINKYYYDQFQKQFEQRYYKWRKKNLKYLDNRIRHHKNWSVRCWHRNLLNEFRNDEQKNRVPILLDMNDLLERVRILEKNGHFSRVAKCILEKCEKNDVYLQGDSKKAEEIIDKVNNAYQMFSNHDMAEPPQATIYGDMV